MKYIIYGLMFFLLLWCSIVYPQKTENGNSPSSPDGDPIRAYLNLNNISTVFKNDGVSDIDVGQSASGFVFPKGTGKTAVYQSGLLWGALIGTTGDNIHIGGSVYRSGLQGGKIISPGFAEDPLAPHVRIYRVRPDVYPGGPPVDLSVEAWNEGKTEIQIRTQYELDWTEWRAHDGAPFDDVNTNGVYDPNIDIPGVPGASQTIWFVANDLDQTKTLFMYGTDPMGIEYQATYWEYNNGSFLDNLFFRKYKLINKSNVTFNDMYVSMWSDPDIGFSGDDLVGCDTTLNMVYTYNGYEYDPVYDNLPPPALGFDLLKGPITQGNQNLPMTAAYYFLNNNPTLTDPVQGSYSEGAVRFYRFLQGLIGLTGDPFINPETGLPTTYSLSGDPLTGEGWIDGYPYGPGDRRCGLASGPFNMAVGDTQEVVVAEIAAIGIDRLQAYRILKYYDALTQQAYDNGLEMIASAPPKTQTPETAVTGTTWKIKLNWGLDTSSVSSIENFNQDGYEFQGYNVYQLASPLPIKENAVRIATFDIVDGVTEIEGIVMDPETGLPISGIQQHGSDSGIQRFLQTNYDYVEDEYMRVGKKYYFAVTAYTYNSDPQAIPNNSESLMEVIEAVFYDSLGGAGYGDTISVTHSQGFGDGNVYVVVDDPTQLTGHDYEVSFHSQLQIRDPNGNWIPGSVIKRNINPDEPDTLTGTTIDIAAVYGPNINTIDLLFHLEVVHHYYGWVDGVTLNFPAGTRIVEVPPFTAGGGDPEIVILDNMGANPTVLLGVTDNSQTQAGIFREGGEDWIVRVDPNTFTLPLSVDWIAHDDGYAGGQNETGTTIVHEIGYATRLAKLWNLLDVTIGELALEDISIVNGIDLFPPRDDAPTVVPNPIVDGFQINVDISYDDPIGFSDLQLYSPSGLTILTSNSNTQTLDIQNYTIFGTISSKAIDNFGVGTNQLESLIDDYELRFTGVWDSMMVGSQLVYFISTGGQMATVFRMLSGSSLANHPLNPNPGVAQPFLIRIPFEVWNLEDPNNPYQVNLTFRDRERSGTENPFWAWNLTNRMYSIIVNSPYDPNQVIQVDGGPDPFNDPATWVLVHYGTNYHLDDIVTVLYKGPVQFGVDLFTFTTPEPVVSVEDELMPTRYQVFQNYPNPFNPSTIIRFTLPQQGLVKLNIYNILGERVAQLINTELTAGVHEVVFNGRNLASGVYFYTLDIQDKFFEVKKMLLLK